MPLKPHDTRLANSHSTLGAPLLTCPTITRRRLPTPQGAGSSSRRLTTSSNVR
ncbi:MAG: hypothetical protein MHMPM18_000433 [Marteilia pararefringens]